MFFVYCITTFSICKDKNLPVLIFFLWGILPVKGAYIVTAGMTINPVKLGDDEYFCLGDNRNNSEDSRFSSIGMVKRKHIIGKTWMVLSPFEDIKFIK